MQAREDTFSLDESLIEDYLLDAMTASFTLGKLVAQRELSLRRAGVVSMSSPDEVRLLLRNVPADSKLAIKKFYSSMAKATSSRAVNKVRDQMMNGMLSLIKERPRDYRLRLKGVFGSSGLSKKASPVLKTAFRTQTALAFNAAAWVETASDDEVWGYEYSTARDERVREAHVAMQGIRYPKNHEFWTKYAPSNGWNCRCGLRVIYKGDKDARTKPYKGTPDVDPEFLVNFGDIFSHAL